MADLLVTNDITHSNFSWRYICGAFISCLDLDGPGSWICKKRQQIDKIWWHKAKFECIDKNLAQRQGFLKRTVGLRYGQS